MFKKSIGLILTLCMLIGTVLPVCADNNVCFKDVPIGSSYAESIKKMAEAGIIKGLSADKFGYDLPCTREQFITFLYRAAGSPQAGVSAGFSDVSDDAYYYDAVCWANANGITRGYADNTFGVGKAVDRSQAAVFLYEWAKVTGLGNTDNSCYLASYSDAADIDTYARVAFAWAAAEGVADVTEDNKLNPKAEVTRAWVAEAIAKLWGTHYHSWAEYTANEDGTHSRVCKLDTTHTEKEAHTFNNGELTKKSTEKTDGEITYTCTKCKAVKVEILPAGKEVITRSDLEETLANTAWAYYAKGPRIQYDSREFSNRLTTYRGGLGRLTAISAPELATEDTTFYSVCSDYVYQVYSEALDMKMLGDKQTHPFGFSTMYIFGYADNQRTALAEMSAYNDPRTDEDVDACVMKYINYDLYEKNYLSRINSFIRSDVFESDGFTDYTSGIEFKSDGFDGATHYSYYDAGNKLTYREVQQNYVIPFVEDYEKNLRVGDVVMYIGHALMYVGNNTFIHCNGGKVSRSTPATETIETNGAIFVDFDEMARWISGEELDLFVVTRPLEFVTSTGFDSDPGNDIVTDVPIPESTKSRAKYPLMDIDRTVDITDFGTAVHGEDLTYTIKISNKTNDEKYSEWISRNKDGKSAQESYKNIKVTEVIPEGTKFVVSSVTGGGKFDNGIITWNIDEIKAGETVTLSYKVKVTAPVGSVVVSGGGMVDNIPSNVITNTVGFAKLTDDEKAEISAIADGGIDKLAEYGSDTAFAQSIYKKMGIELNLPEVKEITENLFTIEVHIPGDTLAVGGWYSPDYNPVELFVRQTDVSDEYKNVKSMIIDRYWGGETFFVGEDLKWDYATNGIKEFRADYLEAGDIIVYVDVEDRANKTLVYNPNEVVVMVYDGTRLLSVSDAKGEISYKIFESEDVEAQLLGALETRYDLFFALRPSQLPR